MLRAHSLVQHPPAAQLLQDRRLASHRDLARPSAIDPQPKNPPGGKGQIDQLDPELVARRKIGPDHAIMRFGTGNAPFYRPNSNNPRQKLKTIVHEKINFPVYDIRSCSR